MKVLMHMLVDVPGAQNFGAAAKETSKILAKGTAKVSIDALSIEEAKTVAPAMIKAVQDAVSKEVGREISDEAAKRIGIALDFGIEIDEIAFYKMYPDDEDL